MLIPIGVSGPSFRRRTISECWLSMRNRGGRLFLASRQLTLLEIHIRLKTMTKISLHADSDRFNGTLPRSHFNRTFLYALVDCVWLLTVSINFIAAGRLTVTVFLLQSLYLFFFVLLSFAVLRNEFFVWSNYLCVTFSHFSSSFTRLVSGKACKENKRQQFYIIVERNQCFLSVLAYAPIWHPSRLFSFSYRVVQH